MLINIRGNKPVLLDKVIYTEHPLASKLKDSSIVDYKPDWIRNKKAKGNKKNERKKKEVKIIKKKIREKISWKILY